MTQAVAAKPAQAAFSAHNAQAAEAQTDADKAYLRIAGVLKKFGDHVAVDHVDLDIRRNEIFALLGSSGCGKSTLLRMLAGMETPTSGRIILDGEDMQGLQPYERPVNMMFQSYALFPHMTVEQNVAFGLKQDKVSRDEIAERVGKMLDLVQMRKYANRKPHQLSGGQQQRVALARSLVKRPKLLLLDEPLGALDKKLRQQTQLELVNTIEQVGVTCIMVTHDQEEAMTMASRIGIMSEGSLLQVGTPSEIYDYPNCRFTAEFIGESNIFEGAVVVDEPDLVEIRSPELGGDIRIDHGITGPKGMRVWASIRPEDVRLDIKPLPAGPNLAAGVVEDIAYLGSYSIYHVKLASGKVVKSVVPSSRWYDAGETAPTWGDAVFVSWRQDVPVVLTR
ncbi:polyamine ABC transporter ATP-binding protein [Chromobacterium haemolyticum]|uniref:Spermidine/putrescine import ATP-binding protein PotA n=1 Tax=Chromobacterium haemolyticum TaxID=394935 RepID=A0A1W0DAM1_9NEIS|nr:polyamine ABC transporter ATP-binding protein [Chromobacterium haemolyticum]MBK0414377.1 polyamine ABC transporter ATP-binding protein [Chromobacterium haemolyticum]MBO0415989.1 polyamine ABC transporter ATP-binding protein [Chromobacterium haemolyticum]MBO0499249.1 polyamine ABC transporter ATP-binding protein [Chromobacterium haemolyticum]MDH0343220.1 polyamine ABC transporter ATP-binding protein [Chromobacterium haemolyticum]OQS44050.1 polyamine ABC transporter ATP-binding protein [Chrom